MKKGLPNHIEAEQSVLGSVFLDSKVLIDIMDKLNIEDFFDIRHQTIYEAMIRANEEDINVDFPTVIAKLDQMKKMHNAGGAEYVLELSEHVPSLSGLNGYIELVLDASLKRQIIDISSNITNMGYKDDITANEYITIAEERIFEVSQSRSTTEFSKIAEILKEVREKLEQQKNRSGITGLKTGFSNIDNITNGLQEEELIILAARPSMGKSALALNLAVNVAKRNQEGKAGVAIFSLEMSNDQLASRMLSLEADIDGYKLRSANLDSKDWANYHVGSEILSNLNISFDDSAAVSVSDIRAKCRKLKQEGNLDFVVIDYLQLIKGESRSGSNRQEEVARISRSLKQMARELKVPVLALSQLSRAVETRDDKRPVLADLRESGSIEQDADIVMFLYREDYYQRDEEKWTGDVELIVAKNRQGQSGRTLHFKFEPPYSRFIARDDRYEEN